MVLVKKNRWKKHSLKWCIWLLDQTSESLPLYHCLVWLNVTLTRHITMWQIFINIFPQTLFIRTTTCQLMIGQENLESSAAKLSCGRDHHSICVNVIQRHTNSARLINHHTRQVTPTITNVIKHSSLSPSRLCNPNSVRNQNYKIIISYFHFRNVAIQ